MKWLAATVSFVGLVALVGIVAAGITCRSLSIDLKFNPTTSLPRGLYARAFGQIRVGSIVFFPLPKAMEGYAKAVDEYLRSQALLSGNNTPVAGMYDFYSTAGNGELKPVVGAAGDVMCRDGLSFSINGDVLGEALAVGPYLNVPLPQWEGCERLQPGELAVFSGRSALSMDSRYYKSVNENEAVLYRPWLTEKW